MAAAAVPAAAPAPALAAVRAAAALAPAAAAAAAAAAASSRPWPCGRGRVGWMARCCRRRARAQRGDGAAAAHTQGSARLQSPTAPLLGRQPALPWRRRGRRPCGAGCGRCGGGGAAPRSRRRARHRAPRQRQPPGHAHCAAARIPFPARGAVPRPLVRASGPPFFPARARLAGLGAWKECGWCLETGGRGAGRMGSAPRGRAAHRAAAMGRRRRAALGPPCPAGRATHRRHLLQQRGKPLRAREEQGAAHK
jgi:hypothetical protein